MENKKKNSQTEATAKVDWGRIKEIFGQIYLWIFRLRKVILSVPVILGAIYFARMNLEKLPQEVGLTLMTNGQFAQTVSRAAAVWGPLGVTAMCLALMFCSRRAFYPWLISLFTLVIPPVLLLINTFPS